MECWVGDQPQSWDHTKTRKLWESIKDEFKASYYTIQRSVKKESRKGTTSTDHEGKETKR